MSVRSPEVDEVDEVDLPDRLLDSSSLTFSSRNGESADNRFRLFLPYVAMDTDGDDDDHHHHLSS